MEVARHSDYSLPVIHTAYVSAQTKAKDVKTNGLNVIEETIKALVKAQQDLSPPRQRHVKQILTKEQKKISLKSTKN